MSSAGAAYSNPNSYQHVGKRWPISCARANRNGVLFAEQWNNLDNAKAHYDRPARKSGSKLTQVDGSSAVAPAHLAGISRYLKERTEAYHRLRDPPARRCMNVQARQAKHAGGIDHRSNGLGRISQDRARGR